jgi:mRNA-degrading endonuclease RelE of RelBE toxin-antitoxin system
MTMQIILEPSFIKSAKNLPENIREKLSKLLPLLQDNPYHPLLHTKKLSGGLAGLFSFRVTREWRALFYFKNHETIHVIEADNRKDIYK